MVEEHDDSDNDPDYEGQQKESDSESDMFDMEDEEESAPVTLEAVRRKEPACCRGLCVHGATHGESRWRHGQRVW
jgi:hypothetical protein